MKTILKIARTELRNLFYSPIAWILLILFVLQSTSVFDKMMEFGVNAGLMGYGIGENLTSRLLGEMFFSRITGILYLFIPLLTMGIMSRDLGSSTIKLLYSSPITNVQIILGKYLCLMIYGLLLTGILAIYVIYTSCYISNMDLPLVLSGLLGIYLLYCAYAAIGLFMSSLTSYQIVAALGTFAVLAVLKMVGTWWQDIELVRDITWWLSINGRASTFIYGLLCSEDILYFILLVFLFIVMTVIRLQSRRKHTSFGRLALRYLTVWILVFGIGYFSSRPALMTYYDTTRTKQNTLTQNSQEIVGKARGGMTVTTYVNLLGSNAWIGLPRNVVRDMGSFSAYTRFKPEIKMKYVYYYDDCKDTREKLEEKFPGLSLEEKAKKMAETEEVSFNLFLSPEQIREKIDLSDEDNDFIRVLERESGEKAFLRVFKDMGVYPGEREISTAIKRMVMKLPKVGFVSGHGERNMKGSGERDYRLFADAKSFRSALVNQGFDVQPIRLDRPVPEDISILVIADMKSGLNETEEGVLNAFIRQGGNLLIAGETRRQEWMNPIVEQFGIRFLPGCLVQPSKDYSADLIVANPTPESVDIAYEFSELLNRKYVVTMPGALAIESFKDCGFEMTPILKTNSSGVWNELRTTDFVNDTVRHEPEIGEEEKEYITMMALSRLQNGKEQKIMVLADADCISNGEFSRGRTNIKAGNFGLIAPTFFWLSDGEVPLDIRRPKPIDGDFSMNDSQYSRMRILLYGLLPVILLLIFLFIKIRRRSK